jgi:hypothetical protein
MTNGEFLTYFRKNREINIPYLADKWGVSYEQLTTLIVDNFHHYPNAGMVDQLYFFEQPRQEWYYEVCDTKYRRGKVVRSEDLDTYCFTNDKTDQHHSVYAHERTWIQKVREGGGKVSSVGEHTIKMETLYIELDRKADGGLEKAIIDAQYIVNTLRRISRLEPVAYYSGNTSIHIAVDARLFGSPIARSSHLAGFGKWAYNLAHTIAGDVRYRNGLYDSWTTPIREVIEAHTKAYGVRGDKDRVRQIMENIDPNIYGANSLIRAPWSFHEKSGFQKVPWETANIAERLPTFVDRKHTVPPILLHEYIKAQTTIKEKKTVECEHNIDYITSEFAETFDDFDPTECDNKGWVRGLFNPWYKDTNPSLSVNVVTGQIYDFGHPDYRTSFIGFLMKKYELTYEQAMILNDANQ